MLVFKYIHMKMLEIINNTLKYAYNQAQIRRIIQEHKQVDDDWEVPLDRIAMYPDDYHRCGSQGDVYLGRLSNSPVAVKRVRDETLTDIRHLKDLNHKNIIKFLGVSRDPRRNYHYIIMEWCNNGTLAQKLHDTHPIISPSNLCDFAQAIASGMKYLHSKNIIHRDLKPTNILLTRTYELKISDFGTHKVFGGQSSMSNSSQAGTCAYMAPEVIRGEAHSFSIDIWSYGVVLWEMFVGLRPYNNMDSTPVLYAVGYNSHHLPIPTGFPEGLSFILKRCWHAKPSERMTFPQVCTMLKGATPELRKISKERWPPTQAGWKKEAREKHLELKTDSCEDETVSQKLKIYEEAAEQALETRNKNINLHYQLLECCMLVARDRREVQSREKLVAEREEAVAKLEAESLNRMNEYNRLKELIHQINDELDRRGIALECLQNQEPKQQNGEPVKRQEDSEKNNDQRQQDKIDHQKQIAYTIEESCESAATNL